MLTSLLPRDHAALAEAVGKRSPYSSGECRRRASLEYTGDKNAHGRRPQLEAAMLEKLFCSPHLTLWVLR
jgi:hypothetical protein